MKFKYLAGALALPLFLVGCQGDDEYTYSIEGTVKYRQLDFNCEKPKEMGFLAATSSGGSGTKSSKTKTSKGSDNKAHAPVSVPDSPPKKVSKPQGVSCKTEYELYIANGDGLFEQDVTSEHYEKCTETKQFPDCTK